MFSSSSNRGRIINGDGTRNVYCLQCGAFICSTTLAIGKAICELCQRSMNGEPLTEEAIRQYEAQKMGRADVSLVVVPTYPEEAKKFSLRMMASDLLNALGLPKEDKKKSLGSVKVAKEKRRGRLLENINLESLGSMQEVDAALKKDK